MEKELFGRFRISYNFLNPQQSDDILSVGCKEAVLESKLIDQVNSITAIDIDSAIIEENDHTIQGITFEYGDIVNGIDYPSESFDKILFLEVIEHLPENNELRALHELFRLLKKGGTMVLSTPNDTFLTALFDPAYWLIGHRHYTADNLKEMLGKAGFTVESVFTGGGFIELLWIPVFYGLLKLKLAQCAAPTMNRIIDREYNSEGFYTIIMKCTK